MRRIIYTSVASSANETMMEDILSVARAQNPKHDITGMLLYGDGTFIQVLEGPETELDQLTKNITADPRHSDFEVLYTETISERTFSEWSMAYKVLTEDQIARLGGEFAATGKEDLVSFLRGNDHFVTAFLAQCLNEITEPTNGK